MLAGQVAFETILVISRLFPSQSGQDCGGEKVFIKTLDVTGTSGTDGTNVPLVFCPATGTDGTPPIRGVPVVPPGWPSRLARGLERLSAI